MASLSTRLSNHAASAPSAFPSQSSWRNSSSTSASFVSLRTFQTRQLPLVNFRRLRISCEAGSPPPPHAGPPPPSSPPAKPETLQRVIEIVTKQLAAPEGSVNPNSKFQELGADSLDQVEIVMALEEAFKISVDEDGAESIVTVQDAANLIEKVNAKF